ncbi:hypothetical protein ACIQCM_08795 [Pseudarthrobacter sp. NPDC092439]|uniref:hypothetical protein n=1 Tax=unclassified Pseudarthrobacter TaxID=2647000 RepID=UPI00381F1A10
MNTQVSTTEAPAIAPLNDHQVEAICRAVNAVQPVIDPGSLETIARRLSGRRSFPEVLAGLVTAAATTPHPAHGIGYMVNDRPHWEQTAAATAAIRDYHEQLAAL